MPQVLADTVGVVIRGPFCRQFLMVFARSSLYSAPPPGAQNAAQACFMLEACIAGPRSCSTCTSGPPHPSLRLICRQP